MIAALTCPPTATLIRANPHDSAAFHTHTESQFFYTARSPAAETKGAGTFNPQWMFQTKGLRGSAGPKREPAVPQQSAFFSRDSIKRSDRRRREERIDRKRREKDGNDETRKQPAAAIDAAAGKCNWKGAVFGRALKEAAQAAWTGREAGPCDDQNRKGENIETQA